MDRLDVVNDLRKFMLSGRGLESFLAGDILSDEEIILYDDSAVDDTIYSCVLINNMIMKFQEDKEYTLSVQKLYEPKYHVVPGGESQIIESTPAESAMIKEAIEQMPDNAFYFVGLSKDEDSVSPVGIWITYSKLGASKWKFLGVLPNVLPDREKIEFLEEGWDKNGLWCDYETILDKWEGNPEQPDFFELWLSNPSVSGEISFVLEVSIEYDKKGYYEVLNWEKFPKGMI
ncbi:MAG: hypothetical protein ACR2M9_04795 [Cyanophyceae cyanobacterium]